MRKFLVLGAVLTMLGSAVFQPLSFGRGGGGHSFSGGHSSSSHSSSSSSHSFSGSGMGYPRTGVYTNTNEGGFSFLTLLFTLVVIAVILILIMKVDWTGKVRSQEELGFSLHPDHDRPEPLDDGLSTLLGEDHEFSLPLFRDFVYALYSTLHHARGKGAEELARYSGYLSEEARTRLLQLQSNQGGTHPILGVVIGSFTILSISLDEKQCQVKVAFEANYTEDATTDPAAPKQHSFYSSEVWTLVRNRGVLSRAPGLAKQIQCPSCGAPAQSDLHGKCPACNQVIRSGIYDWFVNQVNIVEISPRPPLLTTTVEEEGTDLPTIIDPRLAELEPKILSELSLPNFNSLNERAQQIFFQLQKTWSARDLNPLRPYETDALFETHLYWISEYKKQHLINRLEDVKIERVELCKIFTDAHFVSVTMRIYATIVDWTESESGNLVCGSKTQPREFSEYWTLIRSRNFKATKGGFTQCPACGAPLKINQAGDCEYCQSKVTSGEFDWVLSSVEQDEAYRG